jgi:hypothetical protein
MTRAKATSLLLAGAAKISFDPYAKSPSKTHQQHCLAALAAHVLHIISYPRSKGAVSHKRHI